MRGRGVPSLFMIRERRATDRFWPRLRLVLLLVVASFIAHDAVYLVQFGPGEAFAQAMTAGGHDGYWLTFAVTVALALILLLAAATLAITRLTRLARRLGPPDGPTDRPAYLPEAVALWRILFPVTIAVFAMQENLEGLLVHGTLPGFDVLAGSTVPVLALVAMALAAVGGLVRWRIAALQARIVRATRSRTAIKDDSLPDAWRSVDAAAPHRWMASRRDAGRAPPNFLRA